MNINQKIILQDQTDVERYRFEKLWEKGLITERDIIMLMNQDDNYGITFYDREYSDKEKYLKMLFRKPYVLCDQELTDNLKMLLPMFLERLYNLEMSEYKTRLDVGEYTKAEYKSLVQILTYKMYKSSKDGISIQKSGKIASVRNKTLVLKG